MVSDGPGRNGSRWRRIRDACMARGEAQRLPCCLCRRPIDYGLTRATPRHSMAGTVHHIVGLAQGGNPTDPANLAPAHRGCNTRESNRLRGALSRRREALGSRNW